MWEVTGHAWPAVKQGEGYHIGLEVTDDFEVDRACSKFASRLRSPYLVV